MNDVNGEKDNLKELLDSLKYLDLDLNWIVAVASLSAQEIAVKKKLDELGESYDEEDFQKLCEKLKDAMKRQSLEAPEILLSVSRSYRHIRAKILHSTASNIHPSELKAILTNTIALVEVLFKKEVFGEATEVGLFIDNLATGLPNEQLKIFSKFSIPIRKHIFNNVIEKIMLMEEGSIEANQNIFIFIKNAIKFETNTNLQSEFTEKLIRKISYDTGFSAKQRLLLIIADITKLENVRKLIKERNLVNIILTEFETSNSFEQASINASIIFNLHDILSVEQINRVVNAIISNDQITYSWGAQNTLKKFISIYKDKISKEKIDRIDSLWSY